MILFGDGPWTDRKEMLERTLRLIISDNRKEMMTGKNAVKLWGLKEDQLKNECSLSRRRFRRNMSREGRDAEQRSNKFMKCPTL
jgi:hypothetical protein